MATAAKTDAETAATTNAAAPAAFSPPPVASALLVVAPGDSIAPAVLLSVGTVAQVQPPASSLDLIRSSDSLALPSAQPLLPSSSSTTVPLQLPGELLPPLPRASLPPLGGSQGLLRHHREPSEGPGGPGRAADASQERRPRRAPGRRPAWDEGDGGLSEAPAAVEAPDRVRGRVCFCCCCC